MEQINEYLSLMSAGNSASPINPVELKEFLPCFLPIATVVWFRHTARVWAKGECARRQLHKENRRSSALFGFGITAALSPALSAEPG